MRLGTVAAALGLAAAGVAGTAGSANAAQMECIEFRGAVGCFQPYGDKVYVEDLRADGYRPSVQWQTDYGREGECTFTGRDRVTVCNYNMKENRWIGFRVVQRGPTTEFSYTVSGKT